MLKKCLTVLFAASVSLCGAKDFTIQADKKIIEPGENLNFELIRNSEGHLMHGVGFHAFYPDAPQGIGKGKVVFTRKANRLVDTCYIFLPKGRTRWFPRQLHTQKKITHTLNTENWPEGDYRIGINLVTQNPAKKQVVVKKHVLVKVRKKQATPEQLLAKVPWRTNFTPLQKVKTTAQTRFKIASDAQNIYVLAEALEPHVSKLKALAPNGSGRIWMDDDLEFAVSPYGGKSIQYLWMVNSKGSVCELYQQDNNTGSGEMSAIKGWRSFAKISAKVGKDRYTVMYTIPFGAMDIPAKPAWVFNVARSRYTVKPAEYSSYSPMQGGFNQVHRYTKIAFPNYVPSKIAIENIRITNKGSKTFVSSNIINQDKNPRIVTVKTSLLKANKRITLPEQTVHIPAGKFVRPEIQLPANLEGGDYNVEILTSGYDGVPLKVVREKFNLDKRLIRITVKKPHYRNAVFATMKDKKVVLSAKRVSGKGNITFEMTGPGGFRAVRTAASGKDVTFDLAGKPDGRYTVIAKSGKDIDKTVIRKLAPKKGEVRLDEDGVTLVDGKRFLPVGWFRSSFPWKMKGLSAYQVYSRYQNPAELYKCIDDFSKQTGAMAIMFPYQEFSGKFDYRYFKDVQQMGKVTADQKKVLDKLVSVTKNSPILGWYLADEPEMFSKNPAWFEEVSNYLTEIDPYRPTLLLNCTIGGIREYSRCADILFPDYYPDFFENGPRQPLSGMATFIREAAKFRPAWGVIQGFAWVPEERGGGKPGRAPDFEEIRSQFYQVFAANGKGVLLYDIYDKSQMFTSTRLGPDWIFDEADRIKDFLLDPNIKGLKVTAPAKVSFDAALKKKHGRVAVIAINYAKKPVKMTFKGSIPDGKLFVVSAKRSVTVKNGAFSDTLQPLETVIYINDKKLADGKESIAQFKQRMIAFDKARKVPGNLLAYGEPRLLDYTNSLKGIHRPGFPAVTVSSRMYQYFSRNMGIELYMVDGIKESAPRDSHMVWQPAANDKKPVASFKLVKPAKMNELRLYRADCMTFYNHRTVMKNMKVPAGIVEAQSADGSWKQIGKFSESASLCLKVKLDGKVYQTVRIKFNRPGFALSEVELF